MLKIRCPHCTKILNVPDSYLGQQIKCPNCKQSLTVIVPKEKPKQPQKKIAMTEQTKKKYIILTVIGSMFLFWVVLAFVAYFTEQTMTEVLQKWFESIIPLLIVAAIIFGFMVKPIRKAVGLLLIILGALECLSCVGILLGIPSIIIGGILLYID